MLPTFADIWAALAFAVCSALENIFLVIGKVRASV